MTPLNPAVAAACPDAWLWRAVYADGTTLDEYTEEPGGRIQDHGFAEVDLPRLSAFVLIPLRAGLASQSVLLDPKRRMRPIFFRRRLSVQSMDGGEMMRHTVTVLGYQRPSGKRSIQHFMALFEDGTTIATDDRATLDAAILALAPTLP